MKIGDIFTHLTVIKEDNDHIDKVICRCDCGNPNDISVKKIDLIRGHTKSCGHCPEYKLIGVKFQGLEVLNYIGNKFGHRYYNCKCLSCGSEWPVSSSNLKSLKSCGCLINRPSQNIKKTREKINNTPKTKLLEYELWTRIKDRCYRKNNPSYINYGGRGIIMCDEWKNSFTTFYNYICEYLGKRPSPLHSLDRIDNNKNYEPGNIRWATPEEQAQNRSNTVLTEDNVIKIKEAYNLKKSINDNDFCKEMASVYDVCPETIMHIINGKSWKNI